MNQVMLTLGTIWCLATIGLALPTQSKSSKEVMLAQATGYLPHYSPPEVHSSKYGDEHDAYGKYLKDYGDQAYNNYGAKQHHQDSGYNDHTLKKYNDYGSHDKYGGGHASHGSKHGNGLWTRDRGYGYEKHYAYDKELATKAYGADHSDRGHHYGDHGKHSHSSLVDHGSSGHHSDGGSSKYGQSGHKAHSHSAGAYGDRAKHYGVSHKAYQPYTEYSNEPAYVPEYAPSYPPVHSPPPPTYHSQSYQSPYVPAYAGSTPPVYPAYKPAAAYHHAAAYSRPTYSPATETAYPVETSYSNSHPAPTTIHHAGVSYY